MAIRLEIVNRNADPVDINIYRADQEIDRNNLPTAIGQLKGATGNPVIFNDDTAIQGQTYHYVFETIGPKDSAISRDYAIQALQTRGPGANDLKFGDMRLGFFDSVTIDSIISVAGLTTELGLSGLVAFAPTYWYKFVRNNKILFVPNRAFARNLSWDQLNNVGAVKGTKTITVNGFTYKVRLMKGYGEADAAVDLTGVTLPFDMDTSNNTCEFNDLAYTMAQVTPIKQRLPNVQQQVISALGLTDAPNCLMQELNTAGDKCIVRGSTSSTRAGVTTLNTVAKATSAGTNSWWPILELVEA